MVRVRLLIHISISFLFQTQSRSGFLKNRQMQSHPEGSCLRYPDQIAPQREVSYEAALNMLLRAMSMAQNVPFSWGYVDRPSGFDALDFGGSVN